MPEPDLNSLSHRLIDAAVLEFGPTEIFLPVGAMRRAIPVSADRAAPAGPHTRAKSRLLAVGGQNRARRGLFAGGNRIRTIGPAPAKGSSGRCQSETAAREAEPLTGSGPRTAMLAWSGAPYPFPSRRDREFESVFLQRRVRRTATRTGEVPSDLEVVRYWDLAATERPKLNRTRRSAPTRRSVARCSSGRSFGKVKNTGSPNARRVERNTKSSLLGAHVPAPPPRRRSDVSEIKARRVAALFAILVLFGWTHVSEGQGLTTYDPYSPDNRGT